MNHVHDEELDLLVSRADLDGLIRLIDGACDAKDWERLARIGEASRSAVLTGRQLWPAATLAEYRTALLAPAEWAARVITDESSQFSLGPLIEVIAQNHTWAELSPLLPPGPARSFVAHERVLRGESIDDDGTIDPVLDTPLWLEPWEPAYELAVYKPNEARFDPPPFPSTPIEVPLPPPGELIGDPDTVEAFRELVAPWTAHSNGRIEVAVVEGDHLEAIAALGPARARITTLTSAEALSWMAWAGAVGGAHGRRRGAAAGRFGAWWTIAALCGVLDDWPLAPDDLGDLARGLQWFWWDAYEPPNGWQLQLAVCDPVEGLSWAVSAQDLS